MQIKTVKKTIAKKMESWLESITNKALKEDVKNSLLVSGGSIASLILNEPVNDYDVYIQDREVLLRLTKYYVTGVSGADVWDGKEKQKIIDSFGVASETTGFLGSALRNLQDDQIKIYIADKMGGMKIESAIEESKDGEKPKPYRLSFLSPNAISLTDDVQIVVRFHGEPKEIHKTFDFIHATNYFTFKDGVVTNIKALESLLSKHLHYQGSLYPLTSVIRSKKFIKRHWNITAGEYLKMMFQISLLDLMDLDVLEEQLIGVDVAYFATLIEALRNHKENDIEFKLSAEYLNELIDRISNGEE